MSLPTKQYENIAFSAEFVASMLDSEGNSKAAQLVRSLEQQRVELLEALKAFVAYDEGDQEDGIQLMLDYNHALELAKAAITKAEAAE